MGSSPGPPPQAARTPIPGAPAGHRALLCDIGRVLVEFDFGIAVARLARATGVDPRRIELSLLSSELLADFDAGCVSPMEFHHAVMQRLGVAVPYGEFVLMWNEVFRDHPTIAGIVHTLARRLRVLLVSNIDPLHAAYVRSRFPAVAAFPDAVLSYEVGLRKPDPRIFLLALERLHTPAAVTLYLDDTAAHIQSARSLGIDAVQVTTAAALREALRQRGLLGDGEGEGAG